ncbi:SAM-dependent methyltransferase [Candidatus Pacearchaeota archaeon CG_4_9_14_3_um_filter_35_19]|nr:MAG: hypothetical protein AUJ63_03920 [Candidatus Pacearchaeota archaeon CG1_02_35_32]PIY81702.1 MAG: SAM-dependent methyltransferase [Candidatus Pacearchaeota archaeon CG_4_10_14_0_8_um_filter_35_169]PJA69901.1 MAG: SAM-dependent methyltransferase [Candidatus Pacearchaeota archaeon CG_4_9_14_3_um_filter_35_19]PJB94244.1 MAG: SAM-dependent methyltransferase [Candidatus Pacearchaeota archaeon CG_4_9_14_0_8_um_filter_35_24]
MGSILKYIDLKFVFPARIKRLKNKLFPHVKGCKNVLDLGSSDGRLTKAISEEVKDTKFIGVDVVVQPETFIPIEKYDGGRIPFKKNYFDCVMLIDVLHHDEEIDEVIKEAKRVSKKYILIKDHYWSNWFDFKILQMADYIGNKPFGVRLPYNFLRMEQWKKIFKSNKLKILDEEKYRDGAFSLIKHVIFKLEV